MRIGSALRPTALRRLDRRITQATATLSAVVTARLASVLDAEGALQAFAPARGGRGERRHSVLARSAVDARRAKPRQVAGAVATEKYASLSPALVADAQLAVTLPRAEW